MTLEDALSEFEMALDAKLPALVAEIRRLIVEAPFELDDGISKTSVDAVHFEYDWPSFVPAVCPLNTSTGYCGAGEPLSLLSQFETQLVPENFASEILEEIEEQDHDEALDTLNEAMDEMYCDWFARGWQLARDANPRMRGFLSIYPRFDMAYGSGHWRGAARGHRGRRLLSPKERMNQGTDKHP